MTAEYHRLHAGQPATKFRMYNWSFLIRHKSQDRELLWDLGMSSVCLSIVNMLNAANNRVP